MQTKNRQEQQQAMLRNMRPDQAQAHMAQQQAQNFQLMRMQNGGMPGMNPMAMKPGQNPLPRTAMANSQNK